MQFRKIVGVDDCGLIGPARAEITKLSAVEPYFADSDPVDAEEIVRRVGDADCALVSWRTRMNGDTLRACPSLKYVGMCCSLYDEKSANVDIVVARELGIDVRGVKDYGDDGTLEFIFSELIGLYKGLSPDRRWKDEPTELTSKRMGIVGMGTLGRMVAKAALLFGMKVAYFSRSRKPDMEELGCEFLELESLLSVSDVVSIHLPRNNRILDKRGFDAMKGDAVLVNTSLGQPFDCDAFLEWIGKRSGNFAIFDMAGAEAVADICDRHPNIVFYPRSSGFTAEAKARLTEKVFRNMLDHLAGR